LLVSANAIPAARTTVTSKILFEPRFAFTKSSYFPERRKTAIGGRPSPAEMIGISPRRAYNAASGQAKGSCMRTPLPEGLFSPGRQTEREDSPLPPRYFVVALAGDSSKPVFLYQIRSHPRCGSLKTTVVDWTRR
jgi:hypothetical protein